MKVFYVVVLVLVAGAVTCYGRTESEGTVFNKTQIHESMKNGTESSSKFVPGRYDYLYLAMVWPRSFCNLKPCLQLPPGYFTVHGLWPQSYQTPRQEINCLGRCGPNILFNRSQLHPNLFPGLNEYWPKLDEIAFNNHKFWEHEYNKHGCCTFRNQNDYFYSSLERVELLGDLALKLSLIGGGRSIFPGYHFKYKVILNAVREVTSVWPWLVCRGHRNSPRPQLYEIRFRLERYRNGIGLANYNGNSNCWAGEIDFL